MSDDATRLAHLRGLFDRAVEVADPVRVIPAILPQRPSGRVIVIGAGKASARMAEAVEQTWGPCEGLVITRYGYARACQGVEIVEAAHPVPDAAGHSATVRMLDLVSDLTQDDFVLALISGGASALLSAPAGAITAQQKQDINAALLASGAPIDQMNTLRKHLSRVKGGQLAAAVYPAQLLALLISDVPGDDPAFIGSGPTVGDDSDSAAARAIADRWSIPLDPEAAEVLAGRSGVVPTQDRRLSTTSNKVVIAPSHSLDAATEQAEDLGFDVRRIGDDLEGEARDVARAHAKLALSLQAEMIASDRPILLMSGGELTVTRRGAGVGGPNAEYALALADALQGQSGIYALACDTDGVDGAADVAGAVVHPGTLSNSSRPAADALMTNDSHSYFEVIGDQVITGPTLTNVNDFRVISIYGTATSG